MRFPRSLWFWIRAGTLSTQIKRYLITQDSPVKIWEFRICGNGSSTQTTWRDYGESERLLLRRGIPSEGDKCTSGRTGRMGWFWFVINPHRRQRVGDITVVCRGAV